MNKFIFGNLWNKVMGNKSWFIVFFDGVLDGVFLIVVLFGCKYYWCICIFVLFLNWFKG